MTKQVELKNARFTGFVQTDQVTAENVASWAESMNGTLTEDGFTFQINNWTHYVGLGDWIVLFRPRGDVQVYSDSMFKRILEISEEV